MATCTGHWIEFVKEYFEFQSLARLCIRWTSSLESVQFDLEIKNSNSKSISICYFLYISPSSNIEKFNCPLPPEFHYSTEIADGRQIEVTTEKFYYSAFQLRTGLIFMIIISQLLLVIGAMLVWKFVGLSEKS